MLHCILGNITFLHFFEKSCTCVDLFSLSVVTPLSLYPQTIKHKDLNYSLCSIAVFALILCFGIPLCTAVCLWMDGALCMDAIESRH